MFTAPELDIDETAVRAQIQDLDQLLSSQLRQGNRWTGALRRSVMARNVQGSNSIEGINASVEEIDAIAAGEKPPTLNADTQKALAGYQLAMTYVLQLAKSSFTIDASLLRSLHFMTTSHEMEKWPGRFREGAVYVFDSRNHNVVYEGAPAENVESLVTQFASEFPIESDPLIAAAMAHLNYVLIHPHKDGNGRMARIVQSLAFAQHQDLSPIFTTVEEYLGRYTQPYYDVLAVVGQGNWNDIDFDPVRTKPWIRFMLTAHLNQALEHQQQIEAAAKTWSETDKLVANAGLPERCFEAVYGAMFGNSVTRSRYIAAVEDLGESISAQTATRDFNQLVSQGLLVADGDKRGRSYYASPQVRKVALEAGLRRPWIPVSPFTR